MGLSLPDCDLVSATGYIFCWTFIKFHKWVKNSCPARFIFVTICSLAVVLNSGCKCTFTNATTKGFSRWPRSAEVRVRSQTSPHGICGSHSIIGTGLYPITSVSPSSCLSSNSTTLLPRRTNGRNAIPVKRAAFFRMSGIMDRKLLSHRLQRVELV